TEGLERIYSRFAVHTPHRLRDLQPGLSCEEIDQYVKDFPFRLPHEVYKLYQWHNGLHGWNFLFENYEFLSLESAIYIYQEELRQAQADYPEIAEFFQYRFPIFQLWSESSVFLTVSSDEKQGTLIHGYDISFEDYSLRYHSLTDLILHSAQWYESAIFMVQDNRWRIDDEAAYWLDVKYMARERIVEIVHSRGGGLQQSIYQRFLNEI
ncbi:SMI1/KNR4 family protein, partial [Nostoc sp. NIES-2111]